jgi:hypothetical protein
LCPCCTLAGREGLFAHLSSRGKPVPVTEAVAFVSIETFESLSLTLGIGGLVLYMIYVMYKLAQESGAGRFGTVMIFMTLGLGIFGFVSKSLIQVFIQV